MNQDNIGAKGEKSREKLIECAARLFWEKGYNVTGISEIINTAGMSKGAFYFYFSSKKDLALAVTEYIVKRRLEMITKIAQNQNWVDFIENLIADIRKRAEERNSFGCPFAVMGMETAFVEPDIAAKNLEGIKALTDIFEEVLKKSGIAAEKVPSRAKRLVALYEGYLIFYRLSKDITILDEMLSELKTNYLE